MKPISAWWVRVTDYGRGRAGGRPGVRFTAVILVAIASGMAGCTGGSVPRDAGWVSAFDGRTLDGWEGDATYFRVADGAIVGGRVDAPTPRNEFLCRSEEWGNFEMRLRFRLEEGVNSGIQFRSQRIPGSHEAIGYQADLGEGYWGALYDESRRNVVLAGPNSTLIDRILDRQGWNDYAIVADGPRIQLAINDEVTVDYTEPDSSVARQGRICIQIHSGPAGEVRFTDLRVREIRP